MFISMKIRRGRRKGNKRKSKALWDALRDGKAPVRLFVDQPALCLLTFVMSVAPSVMQQQLVSAELGGGASLENYWHPPCKVWWHREK